MQVWQGGEEGADPLEEEARGSLRVISPQDINSNTAAKPGGKRPAEAKEETGIFLKSFLLFLMIVSSVQVPRSGNIRPRRAIIPV